MALLLSWPVSRNLQAAVGNLDSTFGNGGKVITDFPGNNSGANAIAIQSDGKIVLGGFAGPYPLVDFALVRYTSDGSLDPEFGSGGKVTTDINGDVDAINALAIQPDGKIVVAGFTRISGSGSTVLAIARYNRDGSLDTGFGLAGRVVDPYIGIAARAIGIQPDGRIVVAGSIHNERGIQIARYGTDGNREATVIAFTGNLNGWASAYGVAFQRDSRIIIAGSAPDRHGYSRFAVLRFNADLSLDLTFGSGGIAHAGFPSGYSRVSRAFAVVVQSDNKIVAAGVCLGVTADWQLDFAIARYLEDGSHDPSFGSYGEVTTDIIGTDEQARSLALQPDGKIVVAGCVNAASTDYAVARYNTDGGLDFAFASGGTTTTDFRGSYNVCNAVAIQADGKIVAAGWDLADETSFTMARYEGDIAFDICLQDDANGNRLRFNSKAGDYQFRNCLGLTVGGIGRASRKGSLITLTDYASDRRVQVQVDTVAKRGSASVQVFSPSRTFLLTDKNTANSDCSCQ
jgi:uncharacterized delta-60 repeat protein